MVRKNAKTNGDVAEKFIHQRIRNPPRVRVTGRVSNNTTIRGMEVCSNLTTNSAGSGFIVVPLIGGSSVGLSSLFSPLQSVAKVYNQFLFQSSSLKYIPSVGLTTPGNVTIAFVNNSETCYYLLETTRTYDEVAGIAFGQANAVSHPLWHEFSYPMNLPARRKRFDVNGTGAFSNVDTVERDCQGVFVVLVNGGPASTGISVPRRESVMLLEGLSVSVP